MPHRSGITSVCPLVTGSFHSAQCPQGPSLLSHVQDSLPFSGWVTFHGLYTRVVIQASVGGRLGHSHVLATVTSAAVNMSVQISLRDAAAVSPLGCVPGSGVAESRGSSILTL